MGSINTVQKEEWKNKVMYEIDVFSLTDLQMERKQPKRRNTEKRQGVKEGHTMTDGLDFNCFRDLLLGCSQH